MDKALLLVVDVQKGFLQTEDAKAVIPHVNTLIGMWEERGWPVVYGRFVNIEGSNWERLRDWHELKGEPDTLLADDLHVVSPYVFKKSTYSAWSNETAAVAALHGATNVVIVGVDTNECVLATAISVFDSGMTPWVVRDCCASNGGVKAHDTAIELLETLLGKQQVIFSKEIT